MTSKVYIFNAAPSDCYMTVNVGPKRFTVPKCDPTTWAPGAPAAADMPDFTHSAAGAPGEFKVGTNSVDITPVGSSSTFKTTITVPNTVRPLSTLQVYVFWETTGSVSWVLLADGEPIGGSLATSC